MGLLGDIRFALRTMVHNRTTTIVAILALSLGMGANATVFSIVNGALLKNMPFVGDDILYLATRDLAHGQRRGGVSFADFQDWREHAKSFRTIGAYRSRNVNLSENGGVPSRYIRAEVTANTFSMIGQKPVIGRDFTAEDEKPGAPAVVILGNQIWVTRYGANRAILGQTIRVNEVPCTVIGVVFRQGLLQLAIGLVVGIAGAVALTRFLSSLLVLVSPTDPVTFALVAVVLGAAATMGCLIPARRATRVDPLVALRHE